MLPSVNRRSVDGRPQIPLHRVDSFELYFRDRISIEKIARYLNEGTGSIDMQDRQGETLLTYVCGRSFPSYTARMRIIQYLLRSGADVNQPGRQGYAPVYLLMVAICNRPLHEQIQGFNQCRSNGLQLEAQVCPAGTLIQACVKALNAPSGTVHQEKSIDCQAAREFIPYLIQVVGNQGIGLDSECPYVAHLVKAGLSVDVIRSGIDSGADPVATDSKGKDGWYYVTQNWEESEIDESLREYVVRATQTICLLQPHIDPDPQDCKRRPASRVDRLVDNCRINLSHLYRSVESRDSIGFEQCDQAIDNLEAAWGRGQVQIRRSCEVTDQELRKHGLCSDLIAIVLASMFFPSSIGVGVDELTDLSQLNDRPGTLYPFNALKC